MKDGITLERSFKPISSMLILPDVDVCNTWNKIALMTFPPYWGWLEDA